MKLFKGIFWIVLISFGLIGAHHLRWERTKVLNRVMWRLSPMLTSEDHMIARSLEIRERLAIPERYEIEIRIVDDLGTFFAGRIAGQVWRCGGNKYIVEMTRMEDRLLLHELCHVALGHLEDGRGRGSEWGRYFWYTTVREPEAIQCEIDYYKKYGIPSGRRRR